LTTCLLYVGSYTIRDGRGIYGYRFNPLSGELRPLGLVAETSHASFLLIDSGRLLLYAVVEIGDYRGQNPGAIRVYQINPESGALALLGETSSMGAGPCYLSFDRTCSYLLVVNFHSGSFAIFPRLPDGRLGYATAFCQHASSGMHSTVASRPRTHAIETSPDNDFALVTDLGLDRLFVYPFSAASGTIQENEARHLQFCEKTAPRHLAFHPKGQFLYVVNELGGTVSAFFLEQNTALLQHIQTTTCLPAGYCGQNAAAHLQVDAPGDFLYVSNRGHDSVVVFAIDNASGILRNVESVSTRGNWPRHFVIDPTGNWLLVGNETSDNLTIFRIDPKRGRLAFCSEVSESPSPAFLAFL
jgi:6-phosphogluconolactonase